MKVKRYWLLISILLITLLNSSKIGAIIQVNKGMLALRDGLIEDPGFEPGIYPLHGVLESSSLAEQEQIINNLHEAVRLDPGSFPARWAFGRALLMIGDAKDAANLFRTLIPQIEHNHLLYGDCLVSLTLAGQSEDVDLLLASTSLPEPNKVIEDVLALAYLQRKNDIALEKIRELRREDLYVNYNLWKSAQDSGDVRLAATYYEALVYFPLTAINPSNRKLLNYTIQVMPELLAEGIWNHDTMLKVVSFLVWRHNDIPHLKLLLEELIQQYPSEALWPFFLAETYHRLGDLDQAEKWYREVLKKNTQYVPAYLRLGMVLEDNGHSQIENIREATLWYSKYNSRVPTDLFGLQRLLNACELLEERMEDDKACSEAAEKILQIVSRDTRWSTMFDSSCRVTESLQKYLVIRTDERFLLSDLLNVSPENVDVGPNLIRNADFEEWGASKPEEWSWSSMFNTPPFSDGSYFLGDDSLLSYHGDRSIRINGFWVRSSKEFEEPRAGYWARSVDLAPNKVYMFSFYYRTFHLSDGDAGMWLSEDPGMFLVDGRRLPDTNGAWRKVIVVGQTENRSILTAKPLLRLWGTGEAEFDSLKLQEVMLSESNSLNIPFYFGDGSETG